jgi:hypothetical protein
LQKVLTYDIGAEALVFGERGGWNPSFPLGLFLYDELDSVCGLGCESCNITGLGFIGSTPWILGRGGPQIPRATRVWGCYRALARLF